MSEVAIALGTLAVTAASATFGIVQQRKAASQGKRANARQVASSRSAEQSRSRLADLEKRRRQRLILRNRIIAGSTILASAIGRGIGIGSSGVQGGIGATTGDAAQQFTDTGTVAAENQQIFAANEASAVARGEFNTASSRGAVGAQALNLSQSILSNFGPISRIASNIAT